MRIHKERFLARYNPERSGERAARAGIAAASQHNALYASAATPQHRQTVRAAWSSRLETVAAKYRRPVSAAEFEGDVLALRTYMNRRFAALFRQTLHPRFRYATGFRLSHAQKSLSVYLKHLWCLDQIAEPPLCPVDRLILGRAGLKYPQTRWASVNSIDEYRFHIREIAAAAKKRGVNVAVWELREFPVTAAWRTLKCGL